MVLTFRSPAWVFTDDSALKKKSDAVSFVEMTAIDMTEPPVIERPEAKSARYDLQTLHKHARLVLLPLSTAVLIIGAWEAIVRLKNIPEVLLPAPSVIAVRLIET